MLLYTRTGDTGLTSLIGGRVEKDHKRVEAYGTIDEVNSFLGQAMTLLDKKFFQSIYEEFEKIQHELFDCGSDLATVSKKKDYKVTADMVTYLEKRIDHYMSAAPDLEKFILPGGSQEAAAIHVVRSVSRRAERCIVALYHDEEINPIVLKYINRLSDYFFAVARAINAKKGIKDVEYERSALVFKNGRRKEENGEK